MKTLNEQIERVRELLRKCYGVIASKNGIVPEVGERNMENLPNAIASTHDTLEELTITQNGIYTPQDGVDGFSKVVANVVPTKRVVIPNIRVTNDLIVDGYWAGELVDTSQLTNMYRMFYECSQLQNLDVSGWNVSSVTNMKDMFYRCSQLQSLDVSNWDVSNVTNAFATFQHCSRLQSLNVSNWDVSNVTNISAMFYNCSRLQSLNVSNWDVSNVTGAGSIFLYCSQLQSLIGNLTIEDVLANNICALNGLKVALSLSSTILDRASLRALINGLADLTGQTTQTLTLGATLMAKLTEEDIAIAVNKNWTVV